MSKDFQNLTRFNTHLIEQEVIFPKGIDLIQQVTKKILNLQDEGVKAALVALGWTPPNSEGIRLHHGIYMETMWDIFNILQPYKNRELSHFEVGKSAFGYSVEAYLPGNGMIPPCTVEVISRIPQKISVEEMVKDLNTLFNLTVPK